jgi:antitoxin component YwqK of YwqJK toxin-antitoxin module
LDNSVKIVLLSFVFLLSNLYAQEEILGEESKYENYSLLNRDSALDVKSMYKKKEEFKEKKKKQKKNVFYGIKTRRAFTKKGSGNRIQTELFFVLKKYQEPDQTVAEIFWFDLRTKKITSKPITDKLRPYALILHGPYKRYIGKMLVEDGQFYVGSKHGRWEVVDKNNILMEKIKYYKGWPKDSKMEYWDPETKLKIKEVLPIINGEEHGRYVKFYKSGLPEVEGVYKHGQKVGIWLDFYDSKGQKKVEYKYSPDSANPEILKKWNPKGKETFSKYPDPKNKYGVKKNGSTGKKQTKKEEAPDEDDEIFDEMDREENETLDKIPADNNLNQNKTTKEDIANPK